jgi:conjugative transposon TraM protein
MKIRFKDPKYIIPLILLPFIFILNYLFMNFLPEEKKESILDNKQELNMSLPDPNLDKINIDDKMDNLKNTFDGETDYTAISENVKEGQVNGNVEESLYTGKEAEELIRLQDSLKSIRGKRNIISDYLPGRSKAAEESERLELQKNELERSSRDNDEDQFMREMKMLDSVLNPEKYVKDEVLENVEQPVEEPKDIKIVANAENMSNPYFNTISEGETKKNIEGLLDEKIKVYQGSRIRIKLQNDILIDGIEIKANSYIYGIVSSFGAQRINVTVNSIAVNNMIYDVSLEVYDLDGIQGLYIPSSKFREFTQSLGSQSAQSTQNATQNGEKSFVMDLATEVARITSKTVSSIIKKNKAQLKYNTRIILINNKKQ